MNIEGRIKLSQDDLKKLVADHINEKFGTNIEPDKVWLGLTGDERMDKVMASVNMDGHVTVTPK
jgi:hypothetical protein